MKRRDYFVAETLGDGFEELEADDGGLAAILVELSRVFGIHEGD